MSNVIKKETMDAYDKIAYKYYNALWNDMPYNKEIDTFISMLSGKSILDLGCGIGSFTKYVADKGYDVDGVDFSKNMIEIAKNKVTNANFFEMDISDLKLTKKYDGIIAINSIIHIEKKEIQKILSSIKNLMNDNGTFFIIIQEGIGEKYIVDPLDEDVSEFVSFYTTDEIEKKIEETGFEIIYREKILNDADFELGNNQLVYYLRKESVLQ